MSVRKFRCVPALLLLPALFLAAGRPRQTHSVFDQIDSIVKVLSDISGLTELHPVPYGRLTKNQLRKFLIRRIKKTLRPEEIRADELALKLFGLVPDDFDLKKNTVDLLTEQAAAFYDYDDKKLFLLGNDSASTEVTTLAHELSHALADQHFELEKYMDSPDANDDENLARSAVVEGQASWLMMAYQLRSAGQPAVPTAEMLKSVVDLNDSSSSDYPVLAASPLYVRQSLLFPYTQGTLFFDAIYRKTGKDAFSRVFKTPPADSAEIYHPERYLSGWKHSKPGLPGVSLQGEWEDISEGEVGEFDHRLLLWQFRSEKEAKDLGPHLVGGQFRVRAAAKGHHPVLLYRSEWDSEQAARVFFDAFEIILQHKWKQCDVTTRNATTLAGHSESGYFLATLSHRQVSSVEGLPSPVGPPSLETPRRLASQLR